MIVIGTIVGVYFGGVFGMILGALLPRLLLGVWLLPNLALSALRVPPADRAAIWRELVHAVAALAAGLLIFLMLERARPTAIFNGLAALAGAMTALCLLSSVLRRDLSRVVARWPRRRSQHR